jgi:hypothetical protein
MGSQIPTQTLVRGLKILSVISDQSLEGVCNQKHPRRLGAGHELLLCAQEEQGRAEGVPASPSTLGAKAEPPARPGAHRCLGSSREFSPIPPPHPPLPFSVHTESASPQPVCQGGERQQSDDGFPVLYLFMIQELRPQEDPMSDWTTVS